MPPWNGHPCEWMNDGADACVPLDEPPAATCSRGIIVVKGKSLSPRDNDAWVAAIRDDGGADPVAPVAIDELRHYLTRMLAKVLNRQADVTDDDLADFTQDALVRIVASIDSFRGDSAFTTWATAVATRVAFTALRRRRARAEGQRRFEEATKHALEPTTLQYAVPGEVGESRAHLFSALAKAIDNTLSERQRIAIQCELRGLPTIEIARRLGTNQNALYKLAHDARKKLRAALQESGFTPESVNDTLAEREDP
jgi:RNA polymerase sigma-70 factor (ECF subfamily)